MPFFRLLGLFSDHFYTQNRSDFLLFSKNCDFLFIQKQKVGTIFYYLQKIIPIFCLNKKSDLISRAIQIKATHLNLFCSSGSTRSTRISLCFENVRYIYRKNLTDLLFIQNIGPIFCLPGKQKIDPIFCISEKLNMVKNLRQKVGPFILYI